MRRIRPSQQKLSTERNKWFQISSRELQTKRATRYYCGEKDHYMRDCKVKKKADMITASERSEAKEFENVAADDEKYEPTNDESIKEVGF